jgi:hypothetical protein
MTDKVKDIDGFVFNLWSRYYKSARYLIMERDLVADWRQTMFLISCELKHSKITDQTKASRFVQKLFRSLFFKPYGFRRPGNIWQHFDESISNNKNKALKILYSSCND